MENNREQMVLKNMWFFNFDFFSFFFPDFCDFGSILGGPGPSKNCKKSEKIDFLTRSVLNQVSGRVLGRFWEDFNEVLDGFGTDF